MKIRLSFILAIAISMLSTTLKAENVDRFFNIEGTSIRITAIENSKTVMVTLNNTSKGDVTVALEDAFGANFATDKVKSTAKFAKKYNLAQLETGNYRLVVTKNFVKTIQPFELTSRNIVLNELERREKFLPSIKHTGNTLDVNVLLGNYSNIVVRIYGNDGLVSFEDKNYVVLTLHKRFDLSKLPAGTYIVEVMAGDDTQFYNINL
jgi:fibronectin type 3 domain-containing protein